MRIINKKVSQMGRSMLEVLVVIALMGVLSLGAISGYSWGLDRYNANALEDDIMQRGADIKTQLDRRNRTSVHLDKWDTFSKIGTPIGLKKDSIGIQVDKVKQRICQMTFDDLISLSAIEVNGVEYTTPQNNVCNAGAENTMIFYFATDRKNIVKYNRCIPDCLPPFLCQKGLCVCPPDTPIGADPTTCDCNIDQIKTNGRCECLGGGIPYNGACVGCVSDSDCNENSTCTNHICSCVAQDCPMSDFSSTICSCCPETEPKWLADEEICKSCYEIDPTKPIYNTETKECDACPPETPEWDGTKCVGCPVGSTMSGDTCVCNSECQTYDASTKACVNKADGTVCSNGLCKAGSCLNDTCPVGEYVSCSSNLIATLASTTDYGTTCYTCGCPTGSTMSGDTCVCNNECQTYDIFTKTCVNKANGTVCTNGVCSGGMCINDTCPSGTHKSCASDLVATKTAQTASGTWCYTCGCPSGAILSGTTCTCTSECQTYDTSAKMCANKTEGTVCSDGLCKNGSCLNDTCPLGEYTSCSANLVATASSKTAYGTQCYTCGCPSGSTLSGSTCVCNSECQTYNTSTKTCTNKANGTTCTNGLCSNGSCKNDTCPSGTVKTCSANLVATASSKTAYGTQCYTCGCPSGSTLSSDGTTCVCNNECQTYNASTKTCVSKTDGTTCSTGLCKTGVCTNDTCPTGTAKTCSTNLVATASSKTAYGTQCYTCGCPTGSTMSGDTCVCNNECQTYDIFTKTCVNKTDGTTCSNGLCKTGSCLNDTCSKGQKTCSSGYTKTQVSTTAYGSPCYQCCATPKVWNGTACACPSNTPKYASTSTCACASGETNQNGVCTPSLYPTCKTYCQNRNSTSSSTTGKTCSNVTSLQNINVKMYLQYNVAVNGSKTYQLVVVGTNKNTTQSITKTATLDSGITTFETPCGMGQATMYGSYVKIYTNDTGCNGLIQGWTTCYFKDAKELSNAQKTTCNPFCNKYASRYGW